MRYCSRRSEVQKLECEGNIADKSPDCIHTLIYIYDPIFHALGCVAMAHRHKDIMCAYVLMHSLTDILTHTLPYTYALRLTHTSSSPKHRDLGAIRGPGS